MNTRRIAGLVARARADLALERVPDTRSRRGRRWRLDAVLSAALTSLLAGCRSAADAETLTAQLSLPIRRKLRIARRLPDTTLRTALLQIPLAALRALLHRQTRAAHRRKALVPIGLPWGVVAIDGKYTATTMADDTYAQEQDGTHIVRTMTSALVSGRAPGPRPSASTRCRCRLTSTSRRRSCRHSTGSSTATAEARSSES